MSFDRKAAERILQLRFESGVQTRVDELAERASNGLLTTNEECEYRRYIDVADLLSILKLKARRLLEADDG
jgi:hypothetical protein